MSDPAGRLDIVLQRTRKGLSCRIRSSRPVTASRVFRGRSAEETTALLPSLYSICAKAQSFACTGALEAALDLCASAEQWRRRTLAVELETVREHLWRMLLDWPRMLDAPPERKALADLLPIVKTLFGTADPDGHLFRPGTNSVDWSRVSWSREVTTLERLIEAHVLGRETRHWIEEIRDEASLEHWTETTETGPAQLLRSLITRGEQGLGRSPVSALPAMDDHALAARLLAPDSADLTARPTWDGTAQETTPLSRHLQSPLIQALTSAYGNGLLTRLAAQLLEVATLAARLHETEPTPAAETLPESPVGGTSVARGTSDPAAEAAPTTPNSCLSGDLQTASETTPHTAAQIAQHRATSPGRNATSPSIDIGTGIGIGRAEAARGLLIHLARLEQDRVADYRILAPTEWNFHPEGPLALALSGLPDSDEHQLRRRAELLIMAIDPCVAYVLELSSDI